MDEIYAEYGYYRDALDSFTLKGKDGLEQIGTMMSELRSSGSPFSDTAQIIAGLWMQVRDLALCRHQTYLSIS